ncbi:MAG: hypothetical protein EOP33_05350 [Rickettsiaceae bacterium]|nr:MAG: hypothetical protein EOP33_05350 [Rickettsiaceae bacterium]
MKSIIIDDKIEKIQSMQVFLHALSKEANFTSPVYHVLLKDKSALVLKMTEEVYVLPQLIIELAKIIGEVAAYKFSEKTGINLVPKTQLVTYKDNVSSSQEFISNEIDRNKYSHLLSSDNSNIELLKMFWFIVGQWDAHTGNVLFRTEQQPIAIDNANIANLQKVNYYGGHQFIRLFYTDKTNEGSIDHPILIKGSGKKVLAQLYENFSEELPDYYVQVYNKLAQVDTSFSYFVEDNRVWRNFCTPDSYFTKNFSKDTLEKLKLIKDISHQTFAHLIEKCTNSVSMKVLDELKVSRIEVSTQLTQHFAQIEIGIETRYKLAENYLNSQELSEVAVDLNGTSDINF